MATVRSIRSLRLDELLGSALAALVEAEATAVKTTAEFIESVGFTQTAKSAKPADGGRSADDLGHLRELRFRYTKLGADNEPHEFELVLPMLAMVPIPALQIDEAKLSMAVRILDVEVAPSPATAPSANRVAVQPLGLPQLLRADRLRLVAMPAAKQGAVDGSRSRDTVNMDIEVKLKQADFPVGIEQLLSTFGQAITEREASDAP